MLSRPALCARAARSLCSASRPVAMPLRAKILNPAINMSIRGAHDSAPDDVLFSSQYGVRSIELNRPGKMNALDGSMIQKITPRLQEWEKSQIASIIVMKGAGEKAFCAGGDVAALAKKNKEGTDGMRESVKYFASEYQLDHLIATYSKPYVALMDGITMGGGVGLSVHAPFRIATERTMFAMPETTIGFFPDVGGSFFLPRLDGELGTYLALTSARLRGVHAFYAGIATHYIHSSSLPDLETRLSELNFSDMATLDDRNTIVNATIEEFVTGLPHDEPFTLSGATREAIDRCFAFDSVDEILTALRSEGTDWAAETIKTLHERSPTSVRVALRQMRLGQRWGIAETFHREFHIAVRFMEHHDFVEGVEARLIRKPAETPQWAPPTLEETNDSVTEEFFRIEQGAQRLPLLKDTNYREYPHARFALPSEKNIAELVTSTNLSQKEAIQYFEDRYNGKEGVKQKVLDVLKRKTESDGSGSLKWKGA